MAINRLNWGMLGAIVLAPGFGLGIAARAQSAIGADVLAEVVVTAQRVSTQESKTPISMEVLSQAELSKKGIVDFVTLAAQDPSLNLASGYGNGWLTLRGVSGQGGIGPSIPISFDGFFYNSAFILNNVLYDMNRLEILRGPQGTLFGRNASGGLLNVITNDPTKTFGGYGEVTVGNYHAVNSEGAINLPLSDRLGAPVTGQDGKRITAYLSKTFGDK